MAAAEPLFRQPAVPIAVGVCVLIPITEAGANSDSDSNSIGYITASAQTFGVELFYWLYSRSHKF